MGGRNRELRLREIIFSRASCHAQSYTEDFEATRGEEGERVRANE